MRHDRYREANRTVQNFYCGPGRVTNWYHNEYEDYDSSEDLFDIDVADQIEDYIFKNEETDLAPYFDGEGMESCKFIGMTSYTGKYYMIWEVVYDTSKISEDEISDFLTGQMADGWGEGFEQHPFATDEYRETVEFDDYDEDGNYTTQQEETTTYVDISYSPWSGKNFGVFSE